MATIPRTRGSPPPNAAGIRLRCRCGEGVSSGGNGAGGGGAEATACATGARRTTSGGAGGLCARGGRCAGGELGAADGTAGRCCTLWPARRALRTIDEMTAMPTKIAHRMPPKSWKSMRYVTDGGCCPCSFGAGASAAPIELRISVSA